VREPTASQLHDQEKVRMCEIAKGGNPRPTTSKISVRKCEKLITLNAHNQGDDKLDKLSTMPTLISIIESAMHPNFGELYQKLGITETRLNSIRKALVQVKKQPPDFIVCEFFYGYGNNYAGVNISNLDVLLSSLQKYSPQTRVIVVVDKAERQYVDKLNELFPLHAVFVYPAKAVEMEVALTA